MWKSASILAITILLSSCTQQIPEHSELLEATTRNELQSRFGEPATIRGGNYQPDVIGPNEPALLYEKFEYWEYISTNDGILGKTYFSFYFDEEETVELLGDWNWISDEDRRIEVE